MSARRQPVRLKSIPIGELMSSVARMITGPPVAARVTRQPVDPLDRVTSIDVSLLEGAPTLTGMSHGHKVKFNNTPDPIDDIISSARDKFLDDSNFGNYKASRKKLLRFSGVLTDYLDLCEQTIDKDVVDTAAILESSYQAEKNVDFISQNYVEHGFLGRLTPSLELISGCISAARTFRNIG